MLPCLLDAFHECARELVVGVHHERVVRVDQLADRELLILRKSLSPENRCGVAHQDCHYYRKQKR
eukprot:3531653-Pyramimonas_sp.AAC.1